MKKKERSTFSKVFDPKMWLNDFVRFTGILPVAIDLRIKKTYINKTKDLYKGKYIISSNHISFIDPVIIMASFWMRRVGFLATTELFESKTANFLFKQFGCVPIDRNNPGVESFKKVADMLNRGHLMCVFPEGTVVHDDELGAFKSGIVMMAVMAEADLLPVYIPERTNRWKRQHVIIGEKVSYKDYVKGPFPTMEDLNKVTSVLLEKELELKNKYLESQKKKNKEN